jgi:hypothetical protein
MSSSPTIVQWPTSGSDTLNGRDGASSFRPHSEMPKPDVDMLRSLGAEISTSHTATLVPQSDLFVASVSSTIRWALAMGKPVLNYEVFRYA